MMKKDIINAINMIEEKGKKESISNICNKILDNTVIFFNSTEKDVLELLTGSMALRIWLLLETTHHLEFNYKYKGSLDFGPSKSPEVWNMLQCRQIPSYEDSKYIATAIDGCVYAYTK